MKMKFKSTALITLLVAAPFVQGATVMGHVKVINSLNNTELGFIANSYQTLGEYGITVDVSNLLIVSFDDSISRFSLELENSQDSTYSFMAGIVGYTTTDDNLGAGSPNYTYLGGGNFTAPGSAPTVGTNSFSDATGLTRNSESSIWSLQGNSLIPHWTNTNSSDVTASIGYVQDVLLLSGDLAAFSSAFGNAQEVRFEFVPIPEAGSWGLATLGAASIMLKRRRSPQS